MGTPTKRAVASQGEKTDVSRPSGRPGRSRRALVPGLEQGKPNSLAQGPRPPRQRRRARIGGHFSPTSPTWTEWPTCLLDTDTALGDDRQGDELRRPYRRPGVAAAARTTARSFQPTSAVLADQFVMQFPWWWSAGVLAGLLGISTWTLTRRVKSLDRLK